MIEIWVCMSVVISVILFLALAVFILPEVHGYGGGIDQEDARFVLLIIACILFSFLWPVVLPAVIVWYVAGLIKVAVKGDK